MVNQARTPAEARQVYDRIANVARQFLGAEVADAGFVPLDDAVPTAVRRRAPFVLSAPRSEAGRAWPARRGLARDARRPRGRVLQPDEQVVQEVRSRWPKPMRT